jgi:hypothetical protein
MGKELLIGSWTIDPSDTKSIELYGNIKMEFTSDGMLIYRIVTNNRLQQINMIYETSGNILITDQPSHPSKEESIYEVLPDGRLKLVQDRQESFYIKEL